MQALPGVSQLERHVREEHNDTATGKMKANFKQFIGKAKTTLTKQRGGLEDSVISEGAAAVGVRREGEEEGYQSIIGVSGINTLLWPEQEFGKYRDHLDVFRKVRDSRVQRIAVETNRLLVRLEKLLRLLKNEHAMKQKQLKALEQDIVPWKKDSESKRCMKCSREFNIHRRKHHCRLCGDVICKKCSSFFPFSEAYQLMSDNPNYKSLLPDPAATASKQKKNKLKRFLKDDDDEDEDTSDEMRVCPSCEELLVRQLARMSSEGKTEVVGLYEKMQATMTDAEKLKPKYLEMADSLLSGEYHFRLMDAQNVRQDLVKLYEVVDALSKRIMNLKYNDGGEPSPSCLKVQRNIRLFASSYLQDNLLMLPGLPTVEKLKDLRREKEREIEEKKLRLLKEKEEKRELEIAAAAAANKRDSGAFFGSKKEPSTSQLPSGGMKKENSSSLRLDISFSAIDSKVRISPSFKRKAKAVFGIKESGETSSTSNRGWTAEAAVTECHDDGELDPFELQRQQLLGYIAQAEQAKRFDEVATLKESLHEIEALMVERGRT